MRRLTQSELKSVLRYNPETGVFIWVKKSSRNIKYGQVAGSRHGNGYVCIGLNGKIHKAHRLAWLFVNGYLPEQDIDHINGVKYDNRIVNLREVSQSCNTKNCGNLASNKSGVKGVYWNRAGGKWRAQITVMGKKYELGSYGDFDEAVCVRLAAEQCLGWPNCMKSTPAFLYVQNMIRG